MFSFLRRFFTRFELEGDHGADDLADPIETVDATPPARPPIPLPAPLPPPPQLVVAADGWIVPTPDSLVTVERIPTKRVTPLATPKREPYGIVWHWTATPAGSIRNAAKRVAALPKAGERAASFSIGIPQAGPLVVLAPTTLGTWAQGGATAMKFRRDGNRYVPALESMLSGNAIFLGVELENVGEVRMVNGKWRSWPFTKDGKPAGHVVAEEHTEEFQLPGDRMRRYELFTEHQIHLATELVRALAIAYPGSITRESCSWSHAQIDPSRKTDPGPLWMEEILPKILDEVFP
jgi:hypothetical protein